MRPSCSIWGGLFLALITFATAIAQDAPRRVAGAIVRFDGAVLDVKTASGENVRAKLSERISISVRGASDLSRVQPGSYIGTTAAPRADGTLVASEIHIFPEAMRGNSEGHRPSSAGNSTMTNATVSRISGGSATRNTMTNATVAGVGAANGERTLHLTYKDGEKVVVVPGGTPVMTYDAGDRSMLVPGAHVVLSVTTGAAGTLVAQRVTVGKDGYVPPL